MKQPDISADECARLAALHSLGILDTGPDERFDRLTRLAKRVFGVNVALVSLVDDKRQWFKSKAGLAACETPREISFCGHAILDNGVFIIPDARYDERFSDNPLVLGEPNIRFYAGCPLSLNGHKVGTLCIIDSEPRYMGFDEIETLKDLAAIVERELTAIQLATRDELTQILNRRGFLALADHTFKLCQREAVPLTLIFMDLNKFKEINDRFGHAQGDQALLRFANCLRQEFRESDLIARIGGDEFVVLLAKTTRACAAESIARLQKHVDLYNQEPDQCYEIAFSPGVVEFEPARHSTIDDLLSEGDSLMYAMKRSSSA